MNTIELIKKYAQRDDLIDICNQLNTSETAHFHLKSLSGSSRSFISTALFNMLDRSFLFVMNDKESAAYFYNDIEVLLNEQEKKTEEKRVFFFPASFKKLLKSEQEENEFLLTRTEVINRLSAHNNEALFIVTYPDAIYEKIVSKNFFETQLFILKTGESLDLQELTDTLTDRGFTRVDFTIEPGQFSIRGGIIDVFSYHNERPFRIELSGNQIESLRSFDAASQISTGLEQMIKIVPSISHMPIETEKSSFLSFFSEKSILGFEDMHFFFETIKKHWDATLDSFFKKNMETDASLYYTSSKEFENLLNCFSIIDMSSRSYHKKVVAIKFDTSPQPVFNKKFGFLIQNLQQNKLSGILNYIFVSTESQARRLENIYADMKDSEEAPVPYSIIQKTIHEGFIDHTLKIAFYTDHQIFERYHRFKLREGYKSRQVFTLKELNNLMPGDYITHIDHGIGKFSGLEKIEVNGHTQEALRIIYKDNDLLYLSVHSLHRITKYTGKEGTAPVLHKIGSQVWQNLKAKTKKKVKDIAKDLIKLYAKRKAANGYACMPDTYLQQELEASFIYEDTPDQIKATADIKKDLETGNPMDRLICGDVGFGKTELAVRAAFKMTTESKQVAILVPTTILAWQHYNTFKDRLANFPCNIDYISRLKPAHKIKESLINLKEGKTDIIIGTHRLISKDVSFKDLGLLVIDEEQKFGVSMKEKLKQLKVNVDTLTLTATPIPRTLQFSMMGARDLSILNTPPPNRFPIETEIISFDEEIIKDAILYELARKGQVFIVNNRIQNIYELESVLKKWLPKVKIAVGHGQMDGNELENVMLSFIDGEYDILLATTIIESGLDIPNVNTIIIIDAHHFGLSDLHQLRGRVGRSNRKAFCYLVCPPYDLLTPEARKRLKAIEEFSDLGSGLNIAMRDLDIRGAGNLLGAEQSGFISEIGFEMYHRILDEAISELKEDEFKDYFTASDTQNDMLKDCIFESDLDILIPSEYITNSAERLIVYKEINGLENESSLNKYITSLKDRFGKIPQPTIELFNVVRLQWLGKKLGLEKIILKNKLLSCQFIQNQEHPFYSSETFIKVLNYIKGNPPNCKMKEANNKLMLYLNNISNVSEGIERLKEIV